MEEKISFGDKCADFVAEFGGSWLFIFLFSGASASWIGYNLFSGRAFDPFPFILLNLAYSLISCFQAPFIMMSQNRQSAVDRKRDEKDLNIDIESNYKIKELDKKIDEILKKLG